MKFDAPYLFSSKYAKWIVLSLISLFSLLIIYELVSLIFPRDVLLITSETKNDSDSKIQQNTTSYILHSTLFGVYVPNNLNEGDVKKSMLNVTLVGVLLGDAPKESQVIIRTANGEENTYNIEDKIPGEAIIKRIMAGGILVEHHGVLESLSLPKNDLTFEPLAEPLKGE